MLSDIRDGNAIVRARSEPYAQDTPPAITTSAPTSPIGLSELNPPELASKPTPTNPQTSPATSNGPGRLPEPRSQSTSTIQRGSIATSSASSPEGTHCAAQTTAPLPPTRSRPPRRAVFRQCSAVGAEAFP